MYKIIRPYDDGRLSFCGYGFQGGNEILTDDPNVCAKAGEVGWTVEEVTVSHDESQSDLTCDICGKVCGNKLGLSSHKRSHDVRV